MIDDELARSVGLRLGAKEASVTVMKSFWGPTSQCLDTPQVPFPPWRC
ncbi:hypothetical protein RchiOBHm_Chr7g0200331 [Rosa chinensis]|uniref:Uncharacterized protein n=1 Tax=Rosa chinensis TaxID=74649 RepID=A0A2P6P7N1_ROSCH|nr:hypothetical protein RchiOBHm_Chr7g0200331 [Rosa chinensis]